PKKLGTCLAALDPAPALKPPVPSTPVLIPQLAPAESTLAAVSPDGALAVVQAAAETLIVDVDTGAIQARFPEEDAGATKLFFRFDRRSALLARVEMSRVEVFDLRTSRRVRRFLSTTPIDDLAFADDLRFVRIVASNGQVESRSLQDDAVHVSDAASSTGLVALTADAGHVVTARGKTISVAPVGDVSCGEIEASGNVDALVVSQDASTIAVRVGDAVEIYQASSGALRSRIPAARKASIALFPAGERVMIGTESVAVHEASGPLKAKVGARAAFVGPHGRLVFASQSGLGLVDEAGIVIERPIGVAAASFSPAADFALAKDGERIATNDDHGLRVWSLRGGAPKVLAKRVSADDVQLSFADRGDALIVQSFSAGLPGDGHLRLFDPVSGSEGADFPFGYSGGRALFRPPAGSELIFAGNTGASIFKVGSKKELPSPWPHDVMVTDVGWSRDGARIGVLQPGAEGGRLRVYARASGKLLMEGATEGTHVVLLGTDGAAVLGDKGLDLFAPGALVPLFVSEVSASRTFSADGAHTYALIQQDLQAILRVRSTKNGVVERDKTLPIGGAIAIDDLGKWIAVVSSSRALVIDASTFEVVMDVPCEGGEAAFLRGREILSVVDRRGASTMLRPTDRTVLHLLLGSDAKGVPHRLAWTDAGAFEAESANFLGVRRSSDVREKISPAEPKSATKGLVAKILDGK
ncbi:MAG: WD40 repeat domain-containing protein, partial [Polyangiales bacterium]